MAKGIFLRGAALTLDETRLVVGGLSTEPDGTVRSGARGLLRVLGAENGQEQAVWRLKGPSSYLALSPDGRFLASAGRHITLWDLKTQQEVVGFDRATLTSSNTIHFSPDGKTIAVGDSHSVTLWDLGDLRTAE